MRCSNAARASDPAAALAASIARRAEILGPYKSGELIDGEAMLRFEGARGSTDVAIDLACGRTDISIQHADAVTILHELH